MFLYFLVYFYLTIKHFTLRGDVFVWWYTNKGEVNLLSAAESFTETKQDKLQGLFKFSRLFLRSEQQGV